MKKKSYPFGICQIVMLHINLLSLLCSGNSRILYVFSRILFNTHKYMCVCIWAQILVAVLFFISKHFPHSKADHTYGFLFKLTYFFLVIALLTYFSSGRKKPTWIQKENPLKTLTITTIHEKKIPPKTNQRKTINEIEKTDFDSLLTVEK